MSNPRMSSILEGLHSSRMNEAVEVDTTKWCYTYGKKAPSGQGSWWFKIGDEEKSYYGKYSEAKKQAVAYAKEKGVTRISVMESSDPEKEDSVDETITREDGFQMKVDGYNYSIGFYTDTKTGEGFTSIHRIAPYDNTEYHWARSIPGGEGSETFGVFYNGKRVTVWRSKFDSMSDADYKALIKLMLKFDDKHGLKPSIDHT